MSELSTRSYEVNLRQAANILLGICKMNYKTKGINQSAILMSPPGIGKTDITRDVAKKMNDWLKADKGIDSSKDKVVYGNIVHEATSVDPTDTRGLLHLYDEDGEKVSKFTRSGLLPKASDPDHGLLVIDELPSAIGAVQVAFHPLFAEGRLGETPLKEGWTAIACGNYTTDGSYANRLGEALKNRMAIIHVIPDFDIWKEDFAFNNGISEKVISFLNFKKDAFYTFNPSKHNQENNFASPRTWEYASNILEYSELNGRELNATLSGYLGDGVASEFTGFLKVYKDLPDIPKLFKNKKAKLEIDNNRYDVLYATCGAMVSFLKDPKNHMTKKDAATRLLSISFDMPEEFAILVVKDAMKADSSLITNASNWLDWAEKFKDVLNV